MSTSNNPLCWLLPVGLAATLLGCGRDPAVVEPPPLDVVVSIPLKKTIEDWDVYTGKVNARETVEVKARVRGEIKDAPFEEGTEIAAGAPLFVIDQEPYKAALAQAKGELATWQAKLKFAEEKITLYKPLAEKGTVSREELLAAVSAKEEALGAINTAKGKIVDAELNIGYCNIVAAIDGRVGKARLTKGNQVAPGEEALTTLVGVDPIYVKFNVNERAMLDYQKVLRDQAAKAQGKDASEKAQRAADRKEKALRAIAAVGVGSARAQVPIVPQPAIAAQVAGVAPQITVDLGRLNDLGYPFKGIVDFVDNRLETSAIEVRARFPNPIGPDGRRVLVPGMFARVRVSIADPYPAILVAERAFLTDQDRKYVLIVNKAKNNTVERVDVIVSNRVQPDGLQAVLDGLKGDELVIVEGVTRVRPGVSVNPKDVEMPRLPVGN